MRSHRRFIASNVPTGAANRREGPTGAPFPRPLPLRDPLPAMDVAYLPQLSGSASSCSAARLGHPGVLTHRWLHRRSTAATTASTPIERTAVIQRVDPANVTHGCPQASTSLPACCLWRKLIGDSIWNRPLRHIAPRGRALDRVTQRPPTQHVRSAHLTALQREACGAATRTSGAAITIPVACHEPMPRCLDASMPQVSIAGGTSAIASIPPGGSSSR